MLCPHSKNKNGSNLKALSSYLQIPLFDISSSTSRFYSATLLTEFIKPLSETANFGILARIDARPTVLRKTLSLLQASIWIWSLRHKLMRQGHSVIGRFGVYPDTADPLTICELGSHAELYCNKFILPAFPIGINGRLRKFIMGLTKCHPSTAGIILVARKK